MVVISEIAGGVIGSGDEIGFCSLNVFYDPSTIWEQSIAALRVYRKKMVLRCEFEMGDTRVGYYRSIGDEEVKEANGFCSFIGTVAAS
ncbi:hypothetical protein Tco_0156695 [Tanacetum coccineum]